MMNEEQVMKKLGIDSWRNLSKEKFLNYIAIIPEVSEEVRLKILEKAPECLNFTKDLVDTMIVQEQEIIKSNEDISKNIIQSLSSIHDSLDEMLKEKDLTFEQKQYIIDKQFEIGRMYMEFDYNNKEFLRKIWQGVTIFGVVVLGFVGTLFGVKFFGGKR